MTQVHRVVNPAYKSEYVEDANLDESELEKLYPLNVDEAWYWYKQGSYEGRGQILIRRGQQYMIHDLSHCSCYGPLDHLYEFIGKVLKELIESVSKDAYENELKCLFDMALKAEKEDK